VNRITLISRLLGKPLALLATAAILLLAGGGPIVRGDQPVAISPEIFLSPRVLADLRAKAAANDPRWRTFKARLDRGLLSVIGVGSYQGSQLPVIGDYALGYQVLKDRDPATAANYADKTIGILISALRDFQKGGAVTQQYLARGDGKTRSFTLANGDLLRPSFSVYLVDVSTQAVKYSAGPAENPNWYYAKYLKVSNSADGPPDYQEGVDWRHNPNLPHNQIEWLPDGHKPALGATYYVTTASSVTASRLVPPNQYRLNGKVLTFAQAPPANKAVFVQYVYGFHSPDGSTLAYQQTHDGTGGFNSILIDTTYTSRYLGKFVALGLDWLDGYAGLSPALKAEAIDLLVRWSDFVRDKGYYNNSPASNYGAGGYVSRVFTALALRKRSPEGPRLLDEVLAYRQKYLVPLLENETTSLKGGFWVEGWNYGQQATINVLLAGLALEASGKLPEATAERHWAVEVIHHLVSAQPTAETIYDGGDWYTFPTPFPHKDLIYVLATATSDPAARSYANYILKNYRSPQTNDTLDLLFHDPSAPASFWSALPLQHFAQGSGLLTARSDWGPAPNWLAFHMGNLLQCDHQNASPGHLQIQRGADDLLVNANAAGGNQSQSRNQFANTVVLDDKGEKAQIYRFSSGYWYGNPGVVITAYEANEHLVYLAGDCHAAYSSPAKPGGGGSARELTRQLVYLRPDLIVVYDRATTVKDFYTKEQRWHFLRAPSLTGTAFAETVGKSQLFGQTFSVAELTAKLAPVRVGDATIQELIIQNAAVAPSVRYVTALQIAPATTKSMLPTHHVVSVDSRLEGVQVGTQVVLFGRDGDVDPDTPLTYQVRGNNAVHHFLTNLKAGQKYQVKEKEAVLATVTASAQGTLAFTTTPAETQTVVVTKAP
jgi:hypothetical protein